MLQLNIFNRPVFTIVAVLIAGLPLIAGAAPAECTAKVTGKLSDSEMKNMAKISLADAQATAIKLVGADLKKIKGKELEVEEGCLLYSFDLQLKSTKGTEEIMIDAVSGQVFSQKHETPADEAEEKAADKKEEKAKKK